MRNARTTGSERWKRRAGRAPPRPVRCRPSWPGPSCSSAWPPSPPTWPIRAGAAGSTAFGLVTLTAPIGIAVGVHRNRPALARPWLLIAGSTVVSAVGASARAAVGVELSVAMVAAHAVTLSAYVLIGAGVLGMVRARRVVTGDGGALLDGSLVAVAGWIVAWSFLVVPAMANGADVGAQIVNGAYPTTSVVIGFLLAQLALTQAHRATAYRILTVGLSSVLVGDVVYAALDAGYVLVDPAVIDAAYAVAFLGAAAGALHP